MGAWNLHGKLTITKLVESRQAASGATPSASLAATWAVAAIQASAPCFATSPTLQSLCGSTSGVLNVLALLDTVSSWSNLDKTLEMSRQMALVRKARV
jgi:hypothetical protein